MKLIYILRHAVKFKVQSMNLEMFEKLLPLLAQNRIPIDVDLWDIAMIGAYLKRDSQVVRERIVCQESFPKAIRIPTKSENGQPARKGQPLYKAKEVIAWANSFQEKF